MLSFAKRIYRSLARLAGLATWKVKRKFTKLTSEGLAPQDVSFFLDQLDRHVSSQESVVILDLGSRHGLEAVEFVKRFPNSRVYCFEANPDALPDLTKNVAPHGQITVVPMAVNSFDGHCDFFAIDPNQTITSHLDGNLGASSLFIARRDIKLPEKYVQKRVRVPCTRLDSFLELNQIQRVHAIWMDLQGAELLALETFPKEKFKTLAVVQAELETSAIYENQGLLEPTVKFLAERNFDLVRSMPHGDISGGYVFVNSSLAD